MTNHTYLKRRGSIYYARMPVPLDVQSVLNKSELAKSLKTSDLREAKRALPPVIDSWQRDFDRIRASKELSQGDLDVATWQHYYDELESDSQFRAEQPNQEQIENEKQRALERVRAGKVLPKDPLAILEETERYSALKNYLTKDSAHRKSKLAEMKKHLATGETALIEWAADK